jgi:hypothetical protein
MEEGNYLWFFLPFGWNFTALWHEELSTSNFMKGSLSELFRKTAFLEPNGVDGKADMPIVALVGRPGELPCGILDYLALPTSNVRGVSPAWRERAMGVASAGVATSVEPNLLDFFRF